MSLTLPLRLMVSVSCQVYSASFYLLASCAYLMAISLSDICGFCATAGTVASKAEMATVKANAMRFNVGVVGRIIFVLSFL